MAVILRKNCTWILFGTRGADALYPLLVRKDPHLHPILILGYLCEDITRHAMGPTDTHHHSAFSAVPLGRLVQVLPSCLPTPSPFLLMLPRCDSAMLRRLAILASLLVIHCLDRQSCRLKAVCGKSHKRFTAHGNINNESSFPTSDASQVGHRRRKRSPAKRQRICGMGQIVSIHML
jgi:hypothetical protein